MAGSSILNRKRHSPLFRYSLPMSEFVVDISNQQTHLPVDSRRLSDVVEHVLREEGLDRAEISLALVDDAAIHRVNREHLGHDYPTDVISFVLSPDDTDAGHL